MEFCAELKSSGMENTCRARVARNFIKENKKEQEILDYIAQLRRSAEFESIKENPNIVVKVAKTPKSTISPDLLPEAGAFPTQLDTKSLQSGIKISDKLWQRFIKYKEEP